MEDVLDTALIELASMGITSDLNSALKGDIHDYNLAQNPLFSRAFALNNGP